MGRGRACLLISLLYRCEMRDSLSRFRDTVISVCVGRYCVHSTRSRALVGSSTSCVTGILISKVCCALPRDAITSQRSRAKIRRAPYVYVFECLTETLLAFEHAFEPFSHSRRLSPFRTVRPRVDEVKSIHKQQTTYYRKPINLT